MVIITIIATLIWFCVLGYYDREDKPLIIPYLMGLGVVWMWCTFVIG